MEGGEREGRRVEGGREFYSKQVVWEFSTVRYLTDFSMIKA